MGSPDQSKLVLETRGAFDFKRRCIERSVYDIKVPREPFENTRIHLLSYRSRGTSMSLAEHSVQRRLVQSHIERELRQLHSLQWNVFFTAMAARGASQKFPEVAANTCSAIEMQQNKPFATHF